MADWSPTSWQTRPSTQRIAYPDQGELQRATEHLSKLPPLVTSFEIEGLRAQLAEATRGERFLLQGGDCAESFGDCDSSSIAARLKVLLQMSLVLVYGSHRRVIRVGRLAGQYAKPRSAETETRDGVTLPCYRGDLVNRSAFTEADRRADPWLMVRGYERAALTLNFIRSLIDGGFADIHHPEYWDLDFVRHSPMASEYRRMVERLNESLRFMEALSGTAAVELDRVDIFTSHEALQLRYEEAQTRQVPHREGWYNLSTHMPWIGMRTSDIDGAHVEYMRGIRNPIGVKVGPDMDPTELKRLLKHLDPGAEAGRVTLIHRLGTHDIGRALPPLIEAVRAIGHPVLWCCDPMHGNTEKTGDGRKTRKFEHILAELEQAFEIHAAEESILGGVHIELTGDDVTECTGGARGLAEDDLGRAYRSEVDPRLNSEQALEMAMLIAHRLEAGGRRTS